MTKYPEKPEAVYYFGTCLVDLLYPNAGMAGIKLIQREGVEVIFPQKQTCCGQPAFNAGHQDEARSVAALQVELFPKDIPIVIPSGSCGGMIRKHYPVLFEHHALESEAESVARRTFELTEFLVHVLKIKLEDIGEPVKVTWHTSCHAKREMGIEDEPKKLLRQLKNVKLQEIGRAHQYCGFGGTFAIKEPHISAAMVTDKIEDVTKTGADCLLGGDCGCLLNISGAMKHSGITTEHQHIAEFIWQRTDKSNV
ncbi:MAG: Lactate utilization protein A [Deltaproteobacteria bacterium]|nr:Lactate utilization protein A [Deltaproteobacteria bacterium]